MTATIEALREERERLQLEAENAELRAVFNALDHAARTVNLSEGWGDVVDRREYLTDTPGWSAPSGPTSYIDDRTDGKLRPLFNDEAELATIRGVGQTLAHFPTGVNIIQTLTNYTLGTGCAYKCQPLSEDAEELAAACQAVLEDFMEDNAWTGDLEREIVERMPEDGEVLLALRPAGWRTKASLIEAACLTEPARARDLEDWLDVACPSSWSFGVHCPARDTTHPLGYHVVYDAAGRDFDYFAADDPAIAYKANSGLLEHFKRGKRNVNRGVSELYGVRKFLEHADKLLGNCAQGAQIQAAIAYIIEHAAGTTSSQTSSMVAAAADRRYTQSTANGSRTFQETQIRPGKVVHTSPGTKYHAAPMGSANAPNFVVIEQALLRYAGLRWSMPEYLISGDASNGNFASVLVAEAPFVKGRESDQEFYVSRFRRTMKKVLRIAHAYGRFDRFGVQWEELLRQIWIQITPPEVATRNPLERASVNKIEMDAGVLSAKTWAAESGRDHDEEVANGARPLAVAAPMDTQPVGPVEDGMALAATTLNGAQIAAAVDVVTGISSGTLTELVGKELLVAVGLSDERAARMAQSAAENPVAVNDKGEPVPAGAATDAPAGPSGEFSTMGRRQLTNNRKAINDVLGDLIDGKITQERAKVDIEMLGVSPAQADRMIADALGTEPTAESVRKAAVVAALEAVETDDEARAILEQVYP
jgi:hypothetical protein